jgi:hypothetical protein
MKTNAKNPVKTMATNYQRTHHPEAANSQVKKVPPPFHQQVSEATRRGRAMMQAGKRGERNFAPARSVVR